MSVSVSVSVSESECECKKKYFSVVLRESSVAVAKFLPFQ